MKRALVLVDIQNDFLPEGALPVKEGDQIIPIVNDLLQKEFTCIVASKDWHPTDHGSFAKSHGRTVGEVIQLEGLEQKLWPVHCVQNSAGAEFPESLNSNRIDKVFFKGIDRTVDSYSAFFDNNKKRDTGLAEFLKEREVDTLFVCGLATDYCVKATVLDALNLGFEVFVIEDACRGVEVTEGDIDQALQEMEAKGAKIIHSKDL